jgi:hypothetical protein
MGFIETRDHRIKLEPNGHYTILTKEGQTLAKSVSLEKLRATNPNLHGVLKRAIANPNRNNDARALPTEVRPSRPGALTFPPE